MQNSAVGRERHIVLLLKVCIPHQPGPDRPVAGALRSAVTHLPANRQALGAPKRLTESLDLPPKARRTDLHGE